MPELSGVDSLALALTVAFALGLGARMLFMPPLAGFLLAGFVLSAFGIEGGERIGWIADMGVLLLLFTIGLQLDVRSLFKWPIVGGAALHMGGWTVLVCASVFLAGVAGFGRFAGLDWAQTATIAFALSFSSTVFAVKMFDDKGELDSVHGRAVIGILIFQDIAAVVWLAAAGGQAPSLWAFAVVALLALRPVLFRVVDRLGHGEMLPLFGVFALVVLGVETFRLVGLKPDLGALLLGMMLAGHPRASEVADSLFGFRELFLIGFFLQVGLRGLPSFDLILTAAALTGLLILKAVGFFLLLTLFRLRARTAFLGALGLSTYSEFGLIVVDAALKNGLLHPDWLTALALSVAFSFLILSPVNMAGHEVYARLNRQLRRFESHRVDAEDEPLKMRGASIVIFGMGRLGQAIYGRMHADRGDGVVGVEIDLRRASALQSRGWNVLHGDATDSDFWRRFSRGKTAGIVVLLAMPEHQTNLRVLERIRQQGFAGHIMAIARYPDEVERLRAAGADLALDLFAEAGAGFADDVGRRLRSAAPDAAPDASPKK